jgi:transcriptional regulator with XRE-family HTH domain
VPYPSIQRIEADLLSPTVATLEKLAAALGIPVRELFPMGPRPRLRRNRR